MPTNKCTGANCKHEMHDLRREGKARRSKNSNPIGNLIANVGDAYDKKFYPHGPNWDERAMAYAKRQEAKRKAKKKKK